MTKVILVDKRNRKIGEMEKMKAHRKGLLHRAFSILIFNDNLELLLQKRNKRKYHSGGLWTNTVCSHPRLGETTLQAAHRRLREEMGFDCKLKKLFCFIYQANLDKGLIEHEYDCVFLGKYFGPIKPNKREAEDILWVDFSKLKRDIKKNPQKYTVWFRILMNKISLKDVKKELGKI